jgi:hypothetical protein
VGLGGNGGGSGICIGAMDDVVGAGRGAGA